MKNRTFCSPECGTWLCLLALIRGDYFVPESFHLLFDRLCTAKHIIFTASLSWRGINYCVDMFTMMGGLKRLRSIFFSLLLGLCALPSWGNDTLVFHHVQEKLSQSTVTKIWQDNDGFMWFGTRHGLNKFDGRYFSQYVSDPKDSSSLSDSRINDAAIDKKGNFWLATDRGINYYDRRKGTFSRFMHDPKDPNSVGSNFAVSLFVDHEGVLWIGSEGQGLTRYNPNTGTFYRFRNNQDDPYAISGNNITCMAEDDHGNLWIGVRGGGLNLYDRNTGRFISYDLHQDQADNTPRSVFRKENGLWVGTNKGLFSLTYVKGKYTIEKVRIPSDRSLSQTLESAIIISLLVDDQENLWVGTENGGLYIIDPSRSSISHCSHSREHENGVSGNSIWSLFQDKNGIIWVGTYNNGLDKVDHHHTRIQQYRQNPMRENSVSYDLISSFKESQEGLWIGTDGGGLNFLDYQTGEMTLFTEGSAPNNITGNAVLSLLIDQFENLWVASWEGGVSIRRKGSSRFEKILYDPKDSNSLSGPHAFYLFEDSWGNMWISVFRDGINIYNNKGEIITRLTHDPNSSLSISNQKIRSILETEPGVFWLGTEGMGIDKIEVDENYNIISKQNFTASYAKPEGLSHDVISHVHQSSTGDLWFPTFGGGVNILRAGSSEFESLTIEEGLSSNIVLSIEEDQEGNMWVGTADGLCRITPDLEIMKFDQDDGVENVEFTKSASFISNSGDLYFGSNKGYFKFHPEDIRENKKVPAVVLTGFQVSGRKDLDFSNRASLYDAFPEREIRLKYNENDFSFQFSVLNFSQSNKNQYAYMLKGYDDDWISSADGRNITYTNVLPGTYTFMAKGANNDGVWNEAGASITVVVSRPWFFSNLAVFGYFVFFLFLLFLFRKGIINRERLKNQLQTEHGQLTRMQEMNKLKSRFFANISHEFRTPLTLIIGPLKSLIAGTYKGDPANQYRIMTRNAERLLRLINQILDLSKLESGSVKLKASKLDIVKFLKPVAHAFTSYAERQFIDYKCTFPEESVEIYFEPDKIEKVVINLLSNAFKFTPEFKKIEFEVRDTSTAIQIIVKDAGIGIPSDQLDFIFDRFYQIDNGDKKGSGIGLALTKEVVDLHKGKIEVQSIAGHGTTFTVSLLKGRKHLPEGTIVDIELDYRHFEEDFKELEMVKNDEPITENGEGVDHEEDLPLVLIAEDNEDMRLFISEYLVSDYRIIETSNGEEALEAATEKIPDVIVSDIIMPKMNGYELCQKIKNDEKTSHIPVILLTAKASGESTEKGFELGADYYVTKPFNPKLLELRIKNMLKTRDQMRQQLTALQETNVEPRDLKIASKDQEFLKKAIKCLEENLSNSNFGVDDLYRELGLSRTQLYRKLKGLVGQSANEFIRSFRLKRAAQLLKQQEMTISEVTYHVGFNDLQYFRYCFKKQFGSNPSEYAQMSSQKP